MNRYKRLAGTQILHVLLREQVQGLLRDQTPHIMGINHRKQLKEDRRTDWLSRWGLGPKEGRNCDRILP